MHPDEGTELAPGTRVGNWEVTGTIGTGGWARVYAARPADGGAPETVALKVLATAGLSPHQARNVAELTRREVGFGQQTTHPRLIRLLDSFRLDEADGPLLDGATVLVMERAARSLRELLDDGLGHEEAARVVTEVCEGLAHLHEQGWVHGDLKPDNVLLMPDGSVRLSDFGLATELTGTQGTHGWALPLGTFDYLPPERRRAPLGELGVQVRTSVDIWAFGVLVHELFSGGALPFAGATATARLAQAQEYALGHASLRMDESLPLFWRALATDCLAPTHEERARHTARGMLERITDAGDAGDAGDGGYGGDAGGGAGSRENGTASEGTASNGTASSGAASDGAASDGAGSNETVPDRAGPPRTTPEPVRTRRLARVTSRPLLAVALGTALASLAAGVVAYAWPGRSSSHASGAGGSAVSEGPPTAVSEGPPAAVSEGPPAAGSSPGVRSPYRPPAVGPGELRVHNAEERCRYSSRSRDAACSLGLAVDPMLPYTAENVVPIRVWHGDVLDVVCVENEALPVIDEKGHRSDDWYRVRLPDAATGPHRTGWLPAVRTLDRPEMPACVRPSGRGSSPGAHSGVPDEGESTGTDTGATTGT